MKHSNEYLYGEDIEVPALDAEVIMRRIELLKENREELYELHYTKRDEMRIRAIVKAINYWERMQKENC